MFLVYMISCVASRCILHISECYEVNTDIVAILFVNDTATTEIYTRSLVGSVRCV